MKTAVSVPDEIFRLAEATAQRLNISLSDLYSKAVAEFVEKQDCRSITERLDQVYSHQTAKVDSLLHTAQLKCLREEAW